MEGHVMVNFLPTILNQLFCVLTRATQEDVAVNVTRRATRTRPHVHEIPGFDQQQVVCYRSIFSPYKNTTCRKCNCFNLGFIFQCFPIVLRKPFFIHAAMYGQACFICVFIVSLLSNFRVMVHVVAQCHEEGLEHYLRSYVKVQCDPINAGDLALFLYTLKVLIFFSLSTRSLFLNRSLIPPPVSKQSMKSWLKP